MYTLCIPVAVSLDPMAKTCLYYIVHIYGVLPIMLTKVPVCALKKSSFEFVSPDASWERTPKRVPSAEKSAAVNLQARFRDFYHNRVFSDPLRSPTKGLPCVGSTEGIPRYPAS